MKATEGIWEEYGYFSELAWMHSKRKQPDMAKYYSRLAADCERQAKDLEGEQRQEREQC